MMGAAAPERNGPKSYVVAESAAIRHLMMMSIIRQSFKPYLKLASHVDASSFLRYVHSDVLRTNHPSRLRISSLTSICITERRQGMKYGTPTA
jgi:hypothetical protein